MTTVLVIIAIIACVATIIVCACIAISAEYEQQGEPCVCDITGNMCRGTVPCNSCLVWQEQQAKENRERFRVIENENRKGH